MRGLDKKDAYAFHDFNTASTDQHSMNLANTVMVFSEDTIAQAKADSGIDLHRAADRAKYFKSTYTMMIGIFDPIHQRVTTYFNGLDGELNVPYADYRRKDGKLESGDILNALQAFQTNTIGRLR